MLLFWFGGFLFEETINADTVNGLLDAWRILECPSFLHSLAEELVGTFCLFLVLSVLVLLIGSCELGYLYFIHVYTLFSHFFFEEIIWGWELLFMLHHFVFLAEWAVLFSWWIIYFYHFFIFRWVKTLLFIYFWLNLVLTNFLYRCR